MNEATRIGWEILSHQWQIFLGTIFLLCLMIGTTIAARTPGREDLILFVLVLGITWTFMMGRYDFLIGRAGAWLAQQASSWELSEPRMYRRQMLFIYDAGSALPVLVIFGYAVYQSWKLNYRLIASGSVMLFLLGIAMLVYAPMVHAHLRRSQ